ARRRADDNTKLEHYLGDYECCIRWEGRRMTCGSVILSAACLVLQLLDLLRRLSLRERLVDGLTCLLRERVEIRGLWPSHALIAGYPLIGILLRRRVLLRILSSLLFRHGSFLHKHGVQVQSVSAIAVWC